MERIAAVSNGSLQLQKIQPHQWTPEKRQYFLDLLAATGNVRYSARQVGMSSVGAFLLRRRDAGFAALWQDALDCAYDMLEARLLARAMGSPADDDPANAISPERGLSDADHAAVEASFDERLAQNLLARRDARHGTKRARTPCKTIAPEELAAVLERQLMILRKRHEAAHGA